MNSGNPDLIRFIRAEIEKHGPVSFAWFMHQALYHPEHGYYSSGRCAIGRKGDYFTNVSVGPLFGDLLGAQFAQLRDFRAGRAGGAVRARRSRISAKARAGILRSYALPNSRAVSNLARATI